jgi:hypothetical protein
VADLPASNAPSSSAEPPSAVWPGRSALSVFAGFVVLQILGYLFAFMAGTLFPALYPAGEGAHPTTNGLVLWLVGETVNGVLAGWLASRLAGRAPIAHAAVLAALSGFFAMTAMGELNTMPGWFAIGFALTAPVGCVLGGAVQSRSRRRA